MPGIEHLLPAGESPQDRLAFERYKLDIGRGKSLLQLQAVAAEITPQIRLAWAPRSFTPVRTSAGVFDATVCTIAYHFHKHGERFRTIQAMTHAAQEYFRRERTQARITTEGLLKFPDGSMYEPSGRIVTYLG